jgi:4-oxalocrotonate tautomerase
MPLINVKLIEDVFTPDQKREIVERLTDAMVSIEGDNMRPVTWVVVEEVASGDWGIGWQAADHRRRQGTRRRRTRLDPAADHGHGGPRGDRHDRRLRLR